MYDTQKLIDVYIQAVKLDMHDFHAPRGNNKLGNIPGFSLLPIVTCSMEACAHCAIDGCYAVKNAVCHGYSLEKNNCLRAWTENTVMAKNHLDLLEVKLEEYFSKKRKNPLELFRVHPSGDFATVAYARMWYRIMEKHPEAQFLAFTKQWDIIRKVKFYKLPNVSIVLSGWTGITIPEDLKEHYKCAYCVEKGQAPPAGAVKCLGSCEHCHMCWYLKIQDVDTYFDKH